MTGAGGQGKEGRREGGGALEGKKALNRANRVTAGSPGGPAGPRPFSVVDCDQKHRRPGKGFVSHSAHLGR